MSSKLKGAERNIIHLRGNLNKHHQFQHGLPIYSSIHYKMRCNNHENKYSKLVMSGRQKFHLVCGKNIAFVRLKLKKSFTH